jgi:soluble lytic murein transglycosylase-like protein
MRFRTVVLPLIAAGLLGAPASASAAFMHLITPGESLSSIAAVDGLTVEQLAAANGLPPAAWLFAGSQIAIPPQIEGEAAEPTPSPAIAGDGDVDGDDTAVTSEGAGSATPSQSSIPSAATSQPVGTAAEGPSGAPPYPTQETVSPAQVAEIAAADGVPTSLANAVAYQESGFNNGFVSGANAVGVMQITPGTWSWIK